MKVREVIEKLQAVDPELDVWVAEDEEGNGFNKLWSVDVCDACPTYYGIDIIHPDDLGDYNPEDLIKVVVL